MKNAFDVANYNFISSSFSDMMKAANKIRGVWSPIHLELISTSATNQLCKVKQDALLLIVRMSLLLDGHHLINMK